MPEGWPDLKYIRALIRAESIPLLSTNPPAPESGATAYIILNTDTGKHEFRIIYAGASAPHVLDMED